MNEIQINNVDGVTITLAPSALQLRDGILADARQIVALPDAEAEQHAVAIVGRINGYAKALESCRKSVKAPVLALGKRIDAIAEEAMKELGAEKARIDPLLAVCEAKRQAIIREQEEAQRKEQARLAAEQKRLEDEAAEAAHKAKVALGKAKTEKAIMEAVDAEREREAELAKKKAELIEAQSKAAAPVAEPEKAAGSIVREVWEVEVLDAAEVYRWNPMYVKLVPEIGMLKMVAARGGEIPGCRITKTTKVSARST